jgi:hypothetical protein
VGRGVVKVRGVSTPEDDDAAFAAREAFAEALVAEALAPFGEMDPDERALIESILLTDLLFDPRFGDWMKVAMAERAGKDQSDVFPRDDAARKAGEIVARVRKKA